MVGEKSWWLFDARDKAHARAKSKAPQLAGAWKAREDEYQAELQAIEAALAAVERPADEDDAPFADEAGSVVGAVSPAATRTMSCSPARPARPP